MVNRTHHWFKTVFIKGAVQQKFKCHPFSTHPYVHGGSGGQCLIYITDLEFRRKKEYNLSLIEWECLACSSNVHYVMHYDAICNLTLLLCPATSKHPGLLWSAYMVKQRLTYHLERSLSTTRVTCSNGVKNLGSRRRCHLGKQPSGMVA